MGEPQDPCFKPQSPYANWSGETITTTTIAPSEAHYFILPVSGVPCPSFSIDENSNTLVYPYLSTEDKNTFICISELYDPNPCILEINKYIHVADINVELNQCKRFKLLLTDIPSTSTTSSTTTQEPSIGENTANFNYCADWNEANGNYTTVGSNGGPSYYLTYDQTGNGYELCTVTNYYYPLVRFRGGSFNSSNPYYDMSSYGYVNWYADSAFYNAGTFRIAASIDINDTYLVYIGDIDNPYDNNSIGSVGYAYKIGKFKVTNCEYAEFLNAIASTDIYSTYHYYMGADTLGGIIQNGAYGSYSYTVKPNMGNKPVSFITWFNAARYCNWLHNGKPNGPQNTETTEDGAYTLNGMMYFYQAINKNISAKYWIPLEDEWYKAAYYNASNQTYWLYATQSNSDPTCISANSVGDGPKQTPYTLCPSSSTTTTTTTTTVTFNPTFTNRGLVGWNYNGGRCASFSNCMGIQDLQNANYNLLVRNISKWLVKSKNNPKIVILTTEDVVADSSIRSCLSNISNNVSVINKTFYNYDGSNLENTDLFILTGSYNWTKNGDLSIDVQNQLVNFVNNGGGLLTAEWIMWHCAMRNSMNILRSVFPVNPSTAWHSRTSLRYSKLTMDPVITNGLPSSWNFITSNISGSETIFSSLKSGAMVFYDSES